MKILVLGANGMLGNAMIRVLSERVDWHVYGTLRSPGSERYFNSKIARRLYSKIDVEHPDSLMQAFLVSRPDVVINCVGLVKQLANGEEPLQALSINALLPHRIAKMCALSGARFIHISTDCVFSGNKGNYNELDEPDPKDLYGRTKFLGEVTYPHNVVLRTSIVGHELESRHGLIEWFLSQDKTCKGYTRAIFSGLPTVVLAALVRDVVIPSGDLAGLFHIASDPISKYDLLKIVSKVYGKTIDVIKDDNLVIDRSLDAAKFMKRTGYTAPRWEEMIKLMCKYH